MVTEGGGGCCGGVAHSSDKWFVSQCCQVSNPWVARYIYALMFLVATLLAWLFRDYGGGALREMERLKACEGAKDCLGAEGVLRVSLGCFTFYFIMFLSTTGTSKLDEHRDSWHSGWWSAKILLWISCTFIPFLLPPVFIDIYGDIAHFGAGVFLLIQLISIISFIIWLTDRSQFDKTADRCQIHLMCLATGAYVVCLIGIILMYIWYVPEPSCLMNIFFISWTLALLQLMTSISLHPKVNTGILAPGLMGLYVVFICWCAIRSEPARDNCMRNQKASNRTDWLTIISFIFALLTMVIATFSTGLDSNCFQFRKEGKKEEDEVPYGYGFFHFVFATGAMYFAMLLIGWNSHYAMRKWTIDVGWTSTWVRIVYEWVAVCVYLWMMAAPNFWKSRETQHS